MDAATPLAPLDAALEGLRQGRAEESLSALVFQLATRRGASSAESWNAFVAEARAHPLREAIHRDPFAFRSYSKPRGYTPDATCLDYVLRARDMPVRTRDPVSAIHHFVTHGQMARALVFRRDAVAREIDKASAFRDNRIGSVVAFDMDPENLDGLRREYPGLPIVAHHGTLRQIAEGRHLFGDMDLVYSAGMLETLPHASAVGLARALYAMLAPGGTMLLTHFLPGLDDAGFLEVFFDWRMVYRSPPDLFDLVKELPTETVSTWVYSESKEGTIGVVSIQRR